MVAGFDVVVLSRPWSRGSGPATRISETWRFTPGLVSQGPPWVCRVSGGLEIGGVEHDNYVAFHRGGWE